MKSSNRIAMAAALTGLLALAPGTFAKTHKTTKTISTTSSSKLSSSDSKFVKEAAIGGMEEVQLGQLAAQKASDPDVKNFGQKMVDDHSKANDQLKQLAAQKGVTVASALPASKQKDVNQLSKLSGTAFDKKYVSMMVKDHKEDVAEFKKESTKAKDADVKSFASTTLPTLQGHLTMVEGISSKMHPTKSAKMSKKGR